MSKELESVNICSFIIHAVIGFRLLSLPRDVVEYAENDGWISILIMGLYGLIIAYIFYWLGVKYKGLNYSQICERLFGKIIGKIIIIAIAIYTITYFGLGIRLFADGIKIFLLDKTPTVFIISIMMTACLYCLLKGIRTIAIVMDMLLPLVIAFILLLVVLSYQNINTMHLRPFFAAGIERILRGSREIADPFITIGIIGYIIPYFKNYKKMGRWIGLSVGISVGIYTLIILLCILSFGSTEMEYLIFPTITLSKSIKIGTNILERAESLYMAAWVPITFTTLLLYYLASTLNLKAFFNTKRDRIIILSQIPLFFLIALYPDNIAQVFNLIGWFEELGQVLIFIVIPLSAIIQIMRERNISKR